MIPQLKLALMKTVNIYYILAEKIIEAEESREEGEKKQTESDIEYDKVVDKKQIDGQIGWDGELWSEVDNGQSWKKDRPKVNQTASNMDGYFYEERQAEETVSSKEMENIEAPNVITGIEEDANGQYAFDFGYGEINEKAPELE